MTWFRVPYRWAARPFTNLRSVIEDLFWYGPRNVIRWLPKIWLDCDWDYSDLLEIMEYKLSRMADCQEHHVLAERYARQMRVCAVLCRRIRDDSHYYRSADKRFPSRGRRWAEHVSTAQKRDTEMLGRIIGKYITHWWD